MHSDGYGQYKTFTAMRVAWALVHGSVPPRLLVCHKCDNRPCCNSAHHFLGTPMDNADDRITKEYRRAKLAETAA